MSIFLLISRGVKHRDVTLWILKQSNNNLDKICLYFAEFLHTLFLDFKYNEVLKRKEMFCFKTEFVILSPRPLMPLPCRYSGWTRFPSPCLCWRRSQGWWRRRSPCPPRSAPDQDYQRSINVNCYRLLLVELQLWQGLDRGWERRQGDCQKSLDLINFLKSNH